MRRLLLVALALLPATTLTAVADAPQTDGPLVGQRVMTIRWDVPFRVGDQIVGKSELGKVYVVTQQNGDWIWLKNRRGWVKQSDVAPYDQAIDHFNRQVARDRSAKSFRQRGLAWQAMREWDKAIADFSEAIRRDSQQAAYYQSRGLARALKGDHREAIADFNQAMVRMPRNAFFYFSRGRSRYKLGEYGSAIADFQQAIRINSRYAKAYDGVAWIQATCPDDAYADGRQAVANATRACELADWKDSVYIATLAAAYAESGDFEQAQQNLSRAVKMSPDAYKAKRTKMAELFAAQEPYRESPPSPTQQTNATRRPTS